MKVLLVTERRGKERPRKERVVERHGGGAVMGRWDRGHGGAADARATGEERPLRPPSREKRRASTPAVRLADLGSGAGFPGLPIKLWAPHIALTLIESNHKKAAFLREITRALTLTNVDIQNTRARDPSAGSTLSTWSPSAPSNASKPSSPSPPPWSPPPAASPSSVGASQQDQARSPASQLHLVHSSSQSPNPARASS